MMLRLSETTPGGLAAGWDGGAGAAGGGGGGAALFGFCGVSSMVRSPFLRSGFEIQSLSVRAFYTLLHRVRDPGRHDARKYGSSAACHPTQTAFSELKMDRDRDGQEAWQSAGILRVCRAFSARAGRAKPVQIAVEIEESRGREAW
jgi:hypothetical protein